MVTHQPLSAGRSPAPIAWATEERLVDALELALRAEPASPGRRTRFWREFDTGYGFADLLAVSYDESAIAGRLAVGRPVGEFGLLEGHALALIDRRRSVRLDELPALLRVNRGRAAQMLDTLAARGLVTVSGETVRPAPRGRVWALRAVEAYEAKLAKWQAAAEQACRHVWFASRACVVMPALGPLAGQRAAALCRAWRLGLWVFDGRGRPPGRASVVPRTPLGWVLNERVFEECCRATGRADD